jgi:hypothetical protein
MAANGNRRNFLPQTPRAGKETGNAVAGGCLATLGVQHNFILASTETDSDRFAGRKWRNPMGSTGVAHGLARQEHAGIRRAQKERTE